MSRCTRVLGQILQQLHGEMVHVIATGEGEHIRRLNAKACKRRVDVVGRARRRRGAEGEG
jgi:hypothetical protein